MRVCVYLFFPAERLPFLVNISQRKSLPPLPCKEFVCKEADLMKLQLFVTYTKKYFISFGPRGRIKLHNHLEVY